MIDPTRYSVVVRQVDIEGERTFRAAVQELPDLAVYSDTASEAYDSALAAIADLYAAAMRDSLPFPEPLSEEPEEFSGRITLRMPPSLHARLNAFADGEATSLNNYICLILSNAVGAATASRQVWGNATAWGSTSFPASAVSATAAIALRGVSTVGTHFVTQMKELGTLVSIDDNVLFDDFVTLPVTQGSLRAVSTVSDVSGLSDIYIEHGQKHMHARRGSSAGRRRSGG